MYESGDTFPAVEKVNDESTADLLTQRIAVHEKAAWMLRSLLADEGGKLLECLVGDGSSKNLVIGLE